MKEGKEYSAAALSVPLFLCAFIGFTTVQRARHGGFLNRDQVRVARLLCGWG
jgi:hypothetical protein